MDRLDDSIEKVYGALERERARRRCEYVSKKFAETFGRPAQGLFSAPGRTELGGNHTDHQRGHVLAAAVNMDMVAAASVTTDGAVRVLSEGYPMITVDLARRCPVSGEEGTSSSLIRGIAAKMAEISGCDISGVEVYIISDVPGGSGLSSSAAFEVLIGTVLNHLFFSEKFTDIQVAQIGQYAENRFFGKPCGLMDQLASSVGGVTAIDFADSDSPKVRRIDLDLEAQGYGLCIINSGADHGDLTAEYAAITGEMAAVSRFFGEDVLSRVTKEQVIENLPELRRAVGDRAVLRALHFFGDDDRAVKQAGALERGDFQEFLRLVRESGDSSARFLQNIIPTGRREKQELMVTIALCELFLGGRGAVRVHGGGFGGTAQAFVPLDMMSGFKASAEAALGKGCCSVLTVRSAGGVRII